jgi:DNA-binding response OmpR family regulator
MYYFVIFPNKTLCFLHISSVKIREKAAIADQLKNMMKIIKILLVDDEKAILRFVEIKLRVSGFKVAFAYDGQQALEEIETCHPDIVLMDILMPVKNGFQVLESLKAVRHPPIIAMSSRPEYGPKALSLGASAFIAKPFNLEELPVKIRRVLAATV